MTYDDKEIVLAVRKRFAELVGSARLALVDTQVEMQWKQGGLLVTAATDFALERVRSKYRRELQTVVTEISGPDAKVAFQIDEQAQPRSVSPVGLKEAAETAAALIPLAPPVANGIISPANTGWRPSKRQYHTFDEFVVGPSNRVAYSVASDVLSSRHSSLLVIHGATGSGKTHLLESIWSQAKKSAGQRRMIYLPAEQFLNQFIEALQGNGLPSFRRKFRDLELLLLDDIHYLADKRHTVIELQHTIDTLVNAGQRVVLSSDRSPREIPGLGDELIGRLSAGLVLGLERPDAEIRFGIMQRFCRQRHWALDENLLRELAAVLPADARLLAGAVNRLHAASTALGAPPTLSEARELLADLVYSNAKAVRLDDIATVVAEEFGVTVDDLQSDCRAKGVSHPRMLAMFLARRHTRSPLSEIGRYFGKRSHTTVISAESTVADWIDAGNNVGGPRSKMSVAEALRRLEVRLRVS